MRSLLKLKVCILSVLLLIGNLFAEEDLEKYKKLFSSSVKESLKDAYRQKTQRQRHWTDHYEKAVKVAQEKNKYLLLAFVGSDWCPWSQKFESEILTRSEFIKDLKEDVICVWIDFPENASLSSERLEMNQTLKEKYLVKELPTLILLDPWEEQVAKLNYLPLDCADFAKHIHELIGDFKEMKLVLETSDLTKLKGEELEVLYSKAKKLGCHRYIEAIINAGLTVDRGTYFLLEKYSNCLETGKIKEPQTEELRKTIIAKDPKNQTGAHLKLAMLDFQTLSNLPKKQEKPSGAVDPLLHYIKTFGKKDKENLWRIEMIIAQYLFSKGIVEKALHHANASYHSAPDAIKPEIAQSIDFLKTQDGSND